MNYRRPTHRYVVALSITLVAVLLRIALGDWVPGRSPFLFFTPAVMLSAWFGGLGAGLLTTFAGVIVGNFFLLEPLTPFSLGGDEVSIMVLFGLVGIQISWLSGQMHKAKRRAEEDAE